MRVCVCSWTVNGPLERERECRRQPIPGTREHMSTQEKDPTPGRIVPTSTDWLCVIHQSSFWFFQTDKCSVVLVLSVRAWGVGVRAHAPFSHDLVLAIPKGYPLPCRSWRNGYVVCIYPTRPRPGLCSVEYSWGIRYCRSCREWIYRMMMWFPHDRKVCRILNGVSVTVVEGGCRMNVCMHCLSMSSNHTSASIRERPMSTMNVNRRPPLWRNFGRPSIVDCSLGASLSGSVSVCMVPRVVSPSPRSTVRM